MNVPFPPVFLWPIPLALIGGGIWWSVRRRSPMDVPSDTSVAATQPTRLPLPFKLLRPWMLVSLGLMWSLSLWKFSVPPFYGQVLDIDTGRPVSGVVVRRQLTRLRLFGMVDLEARYATTAGAPVVRKTDMGGRFKLPGFVAVLPISLWGLEGMAWEAYHGDYVPIDSTARCPGFSPLMPFAKRPARPGTYSHRPFSEETWTSSLTAIELTLKLKRRDTPEAWAEAFRWTMGMMRRGRLSEDEVADSAIRYLKAGNKVTEGSILEFLELTDHSLSPYVHPERRSDWLLLMAAVRDYCAETPDSERCHYFIVRRSIEEFQKERAP